jgi:hypothetical protein
MNKFILEIQSNIIINFDRYLVENNNWDSTILSVANNREIWKNNPYYIITDSNIIYNNQLIKTKSMQISTLSLSNVELSYLAGAIAKLNKTIVFYQHGDFQSVFDYRSNKIS